MTVMSDEDWAKAIIIHLTGRADDPTPMLLKMVRDIREEGGACAFHIREDVPGNMDDH
jgi:hypothetical protein